MASMDTQTGAGSNTDTWWSRLVWSWRPGSAKEAGDAVVRNFWLHWFPAHTSRASYRWSYSFYLGTISLALFLILTLTGVVLMFLYVPSVERAYASIKDLEHVVAFGGFLRALHRISAHAMVVAVFLHLVRVFFTAAYRNVHATGANRPVNWVTGVLLLLLTLLLSFTGYLLPWDQLAYWAITVGTNIASAAPIVGEPTRFILLGGHEIGQNTLLRFYVLHCAFLPLAVTLLLAYHFWRVRKDGGLAAVDHDAMRSEPYVDVEQVPTKTYSLLGIAEGSSVHVRTTGPEPEDGVAVPHLVRRLLVVILATFLVVGVLATAYPAPLEAAANPEVTPNPAKAPWYFLWLQELVTDTTIHFGDFALNGALIGGMIVPGILVLLLAAWPWLDKSPPEAVGAWFAPSRRRQIAVFTLIVLGIVVLTVIGTSMRGPYWEFYWPWDLRPQTPLEL